MDSSGLDDADIDVAHREWYQSHAQPILHRLAETGDAAEVSGNPPSITQSTISLAYAVMVQKQP
jgi:hypothetical protein